MKKMIVRVLPATAKESIVSLTGLVLFWSLYGFLIAEAQFREEGKGWFTVYFSLFVFALLFFPVSLIGKNFFPRISLLKAFPRAMYTYVFIAGLVQFPVVLIVDNAIESFLKVGEISIANGWRLLPLVSISATVTVLISLGFCLIIAKLGNMYR